MKENQKVHWSTWLCDSKNPWHHLRAEEAGQGRIAASQREPPGDRGAACTRRCGFHQRNGGKEGLLHPRESHLGAGERPARGTAAFSRETEPLPTWGQQGGRQGIYAWSFLSSCWAIPASVSHLSNPIRSQSPGAVQTSYPSRWASWGMGQGGGEAEVRNGLVENEWPYYQPLFIINFHLHLEEGEKSDRIQEMILCEGDRSLEYVLRAVIHIFFLKSDSISDIRKHNNEADTWYTAHQTQ